MAQVFGNRILGGIGAPGGGMAESFGAGVNTSITNRVNRQAMDVNAQNMAINAQELAWKEEDRKIAAQQRAAAAAAAAAAKAQNKAALAALSKAQPFFRLGAAPTTGGAAAPTTPTAPAAGVRVPLSMGTRVPAAGAAAAGGTISGGAGTSALAGGTGADRLGVTPAPRDRQPIDVVRPPLAGVVGRATPSGAVSTTVDAASMQARPGNFAAQATQQALRESRTAQPFVSPAGVVIGSEAGPLGTAAIPRMLEYKRQLRERRVAEIAARQSGEWRWPWQGEDLDAIIAEENRVDAAIAATGMTPSVGIQPRGITATEGPETSSIAQIMGAVSSFAPTQTVTIQGPNGPMTVPYNAEDMGGDAMRFPPMGARPTPPAVGVPTNTPVQQAELGFGLGSMGGAASTENVTYGPALGAAPTPTAMFLADLGRTPTGSVDIPALVAKQNSPVYDPNFSAAAEQERAVYAYAAQVAMEKGDIAGYMTAVGKVREMETMILTQQLMVGVQEAVNFNSAQRLSTVASMVYGGADVVVIPKGDGLGDIYMDGKLTQSDVNIAGMGDQMLRMIDSNYRAQAAASEAERAKEVFKTDEAIRQQTTIDTNKAGLEADQKAVDMALAIEQDFNTKLNDVQIEQVKAALIASGKLPGPAAKYEYHKFGEDTLMVVSEGQPVATFQLQMQDTAAGPQPVIVEIGG